MTFHAIKYLGLDINLVLYTITIKDGRYFAKKIERVMLFHVTFIKKIIGWFKKISKVIDI